MRKRVLILAVAGGLFGVVNSIVFYVAGLLTTFYMTYLFIPFLYLTTIDEGFKKLITINTVASALLCITAAVAGIIYYRGDSSAEKKFISKYAAAAVLVTSALGLVITFSPVSVILIAIASVFALLSVRDDNRNGLIPADERLSTVIKITVILCLMVLIVLGYLSAQVLMGKLPE